MPGHANPYAFSARVRQKLPAKSSAHRIACIALYRALLEQCPRIPLPDDLAPEGSVNSIKHLIRKRFKKDVPISSPRLAVNALKVGYAAEQLLRTAGDGSSPALSKVHTLLRLRHKKSEHSTQVCQPAPPRELPPRVGPYPGAPKLLSIRPQPLSALSGRRSPAQLTQTNGYPFLRTRKPQSEFLGRVLRDKIKQKDRRFKNIDRLERDIEDGKEEETWEEILRGQLEREGGGDREWVKDWGVDGGSWTEESLKAKQRVWQNLTTDLRRARALGVKMTEIAEKEDMVFREERERRKHEKNLARKERKRVREEADIDRKSEF